MAFESTIATVRAALVQISADLDIWFDQPERLRRHVPATGGWSIDQILEHIALTNHFLLLTCEKHSRIARNRAARGSGVVPEGESDLERMATIGERGSFPWIRPEHMEPTGTRDLAEVRAVILQQWSRCHSILDTLGGGEGSLCHITMTVNNLGKIDLYQWLYFMVLHARRHIRQMEAIASEQR